MNQTSDTAKLFELLTNAKSNPLFFIETYGMVPDKLGVNVHFKASKAQRKVYDAYIKQVKEGKPVRIVVVKCRQAKITTFVSYLGATLAMLTPNYSYRCVTQREKAVGDVMKKINFFIDNIPSRIRPHISKQNEDTIVFNKKGDEKGLNSDMQVLVASGSGVGRGGTIQFLHSTEIDYWDNDPDDVLSGIENSMINAPGTVKIIESTANGYKYLKTLTDRVRAGQNDYQIVFIPWYDIEEYTMPAAPGFELTLTEDEKVMLKKYNLTLDQVAWYRDKFRNECKGNKNLMYRDFPSTLEEAFIASGESIFDIGKINERIETILKFQNVRQIYRGNMLYHFNGVPREWSFEKNDVDPTLTIFSKATAGTSYIVSVDTAGYGIDYTVAQVIEHKTGRQVAIYRAKVQEDLAAQVIYCLGMIYNQAWIVVENNFSVFILRELQRFNYHHIYRTQVLDTSTNRYVDRLGFRTDTSTKPTIIAKLVEHFRDNADLVNDLTTLYEARTFVKQETPSGKETAGAIKGCHDDTIMSLGIALVVRDLVAPLETSAMARNDNFEQKTPAVNFYKNL